MPIASGTFTLYDFDNQYGYNGDSYQPLTGICEILTLDTNHTFTGSFGDSGRWSGSARTDSTLTFSSNSTVWGWGPLVWKSTEPSGGRGIVTDTADDAPEFIATFEAGSDPAGLGTCASSAALSAGTFTLYDFDNQYGYNGESYQPLTGICEILTLEANHTFTGDFGDSGTWSSFSMTFSAGSTLWGWGPLVFKAFKPSGVNYRGPMTDTADNAVEFIGQLEPGSDPAGLGTC